MRIYVASSWRSESHEDVVAALRTAGHEVYNYRDEGFEWSEVGMDHVDVDYEDLREVLAHQECATKFIQDFDELKRAEALVLVLPSGRSAHSEFGFAVGRSKITVVIWSPSEPELMHMMADRIVETVEEAVEFLGGFTSLPRQQCACLEGMVDECKCVGGGGRCAKE